MQIIPSMILCQQAKCCFYNTSWSVPSFVGGVSWSWCQFLPLLVPLTLHFDGGRGSVVCFLLTDSRQPVVSNASLMSFSSAAPTAMLDTEMSLRVSQGMQQRQRKVIILSKNHPAEDPISQSHSVGELGQITKKLLEG